MKNINLNKAIMGSLNIIATGSALLNYQSANADSISIKSEKAEMSNKVVSLNGVSLKAIESTWLAVPAMCKARGFNASPITIESKTADADILNIYSKFEV
ncbi:MAG: hypothetical protein ACXVCY_14750 [Pseudobdellovibrionaceae bacterium]